VDEARVDGSQNCGNLLAGVGPFAIEEGVIAAKDGHTDVRIHMVNTGSIAVARVLTPNKQVRYDGDARIDGVPGSHAPITVDFLEIAGSSCGAMLPTGNVKDVIEGVPCTLIDNGMPVVVVNAASLGKSGSETPSELEADGKLTSRVEKIRLRAGLLMRLGDVSKKTVPKVCLVAPQRHGGAVATRTFIPHRVHEAIGVFGAVSVATACVLPGSVAADVATVNSNAGTIALDVEHPTGFFTIDMDVKRSENEIVVQRAALLRTARLLMRGEVYISDSVWTQP